MSEVNERIDALVKAITTAVHEGQRLVSAMRLFQPGGGDPRPPWRPVRNGRRAAGPGNPCRHQGIFGLADRSAALCEGRVRRRIGHHDGNVRERRVAATDRARPETRSAPLSCRGPRKGAAPELHCATQNEKGTANAGPETAVAVPFVLAWNQVDMIYVQPVCQLRKPRKPG